MVDIDVIASGSSGNCVNYGGFLIDCGVPKKYIPQEIVGCYITHRHSDHFNISTVKYLVEKGVKVYVHKTNKRFFNKTFGKDFTKNGIVFIDKGVTFQENGIKYLIKLEEVEHDVRNFAVKLKIYTPFEKTSIFHVTDAKSIDHISAKNYDVYAIENNYSNKKIEILIRETLKKGEYNRYSRVLKSHLSQEQAFAFLNKNKGDNFKKFIRLHKSNHSL